MNTLTAVINHDFIHEVWADNPTDHLAMTKHNQRVFG